MNQKHTFIVSVNGFDWIMDWTVFHRYLVFLFLYMKMFNFGVSKSSACYNLELIAERFISKVIRIIMIKFERFYKLFGGKT